MHRETLSACNRCLLLVVALLAFQPQGRADSLHMAARTRAASPVAGAPADVTERWVDWPAEQTAIVICDMWDQHWCRGATERVAAMAPRMNEAVKAARAAGALIVHAPSDTMRAYADHPGRQLARSAPAAPNPPAQIDQGCSRLPDEPKLPIDDSDGGCDCQPQCPHGSPWRRQIAALEIAPGDAISDNGREIYNLLEARNIRHVLLMGVHTNMCVVGRPFGLRQMARTGRDVALVRDLTDSMYNSRQSPQVCHRRGTELVIQHIEQHVCPSVDSADIVGRTRAPHVVMMIGEDEYRTWETLPKFAQDELTPRGLRTTIVQALDAAPNDFGGLEALRDADLLVVSVRRRTPKAEQLALVREYLDAGRPLVGIRTASHAFDREPPAGHERWQGFDVEVLGGHYERHYGNKPPEGPPTDIRMLADRKAHALLRGVPNEFRSTSHLYRCRDLAESALPLAEGQIVGKDFVEPVAWTNHYCGGRVFYTSLGNPDDFELPAFRTLLTNAIFWALERDPAGCRE